MKTRFIAGALAALLTLAGCAPTPPDPDVATPEVEAPTPMPLEERIAGWLERAERVPLPQSGYHRLRAAELLIRNNQPDRARSLFADIDAGTLSDDARAQHTLVRALLLREEGQFESALALLNDPATLALVDDAGLRLQIQISQLRASLYSLQGRHLASVQERIFMDPLLDERQRRLNHKGIWHSLRYVSTEELLRHHNNATNRDYLGWLKLASIAKDNQGNLDAQRRELASWQERWSDHPAAQDLPGGLARLDEHAARRPEQVALLLPVSGDLAPLGHAIRDGFLAAWFETRNQGGQVPHVRTYDTAHAENIDAIYHQAVADGAELVIGPLRRDVVENLLWEVSTLPVPTLALNRIEDPVDNAPGKLYQFGLAPDDEARQLARIAYAEGHHRALILTPEGSWGNRVADTFDKHWRDLGGEVVAASTFYDRSRDYSSVIQSMLHLDRSQERARELRRVIGQNPEFQPRRRDDFDFIFLVARPHEAQAIKPLLAFHYAGNVPVYATSHIYRGMPTPEEDKDIDGVRFVDIPWVLAEEHHQRQEINEELPRGRSHQRLYALGVDSFRLTARLHQLSSEEDSLVYGETGTLSLNSRGQIERELNLAIMRNGRPRNTPIADGWRTRDLEIRDETELYQTRR